MSSRFMSLLRPSKIVIGAACAVVLTTGAVSLSATAYFLDIHTVTCWHSEDGSEDEPYLKLNNDRIWTGPGCTPITTLYPSVRTSFWDHADLRVMEDDFGPDDELLYVYVTGSMQGQGLQYKYTYWWSNALGWLPYYEIEYEVPA